jgi:hypothetical protein
MNCVECGDRVVGFAVPEELQEHVPEDSPVAAICANCLTLQPPDEDEPTPGDPDLQSVSEGFPADPAAAVPMALAVGLMASLALNRQQIAALVEAVEAEGVDFALSVDRLAEDPELRPAIDLVGRRRQFEQLTGR